MIWPAIVDVYFCDQSRMLVHRLEALLSFIGGMVGAVGLVSGDTSPRATPGTADIAAQAYFIRSSAATKSVCSL